ncbi:MAG: glycosyltransferase family 39 protein, partial [Anaerolineales bacterium]|nr:glycosyltransferase family 39 protein [Anaerolineales bacterium]
MSNKQSFAGINESFFGKSRLFLSFTLFVIFSLGLGIRLYDLTDPPLDFHSTRQLRSAIIARGLYYVNLETAPDWQRERAQGQLESHNLIEPPVFEASAALIYRVLGTDDVWVARILASIFWLIGGVALYFLARDMTSPDGGVIAAAYYMFIPFGVIASRSFQPDPLMVMFILLALWAIFRWYQQPSWKTAILAGVLAGAALFVKAVALFFILVPFAALLLIGKGFKKTIK